MRSTGCHESSAGDLAASMEVRSDAKSREIMRISIGRRQLVVRLESVIARSADVAFPMAVNASDAELARMGSMYEVSIDRARWETTAALYGAARLRTA